MYWKLGGHENMIVLLRLKLFALFALFAAICCC
jgi:hypothetical protein